MSQIKNLHDDILERIEALLVQGYFEESSDGYAIALKVASEGECCLNAKQRLTWNNVVVPILTALTRAGEESQQSLNEDNASKWFDED